MSIPTSTSLVQDLEIAFPPQSDSLSQDEEWCVVHWDGEWRKIRMHDYDTIFSIPGLYEQIIYETLDCRSPETVRTLLQKETARMKVDPGDLRVLDFGAGNGMVAEEFKNMGAGTVVGVDIIPEAREAALRDRPGIYSDYKVVDMTDLSREQREALAGHRLNCLVCVAALGFGDIPPAAFTSAYNLIQPGGWVAFNIKEEFLGRSDETGFSKLIRLLESSGALEIQATQRYPHRLGIDGEPIHYKAVVGRKKAHAPAGIADIVSGNGSVS